MDRSDAERIHRQLVGELEEVQQQHNELLHQLQALQKLVQGYEALFPDLASATDTTATTEHDDGSWAPDTSPQAGEQQAPKLKGKKAAARVMEERGEYMTIPEIFADLESRGWEPATEEALRTTLNRLYKNDKVLEKGEVNGRLAYRWLTKSSANAAEHGDGPVVAGPSAG